MASPSIPTELEAVVLGLLLRSGPATAYAVRRVFLESPSARWSGSAGAVYPLLRRLHARGLIRGRAAGPGRRAGVRYEILAPGRRALAAWLRAPLEPWVVGIPEDPLRTRFGFLQVLSPRERAEFLRAAIHGVEDSLREAERLLRSMPATADYWYRELVRGAALAMRARAAWLRSLKGGES